MENESVPQPRRRGSVNPDKNVTGKDRSATGRGNNNNKKYIATPR